MASIHFSPNQSRKSPWRVLFRLPTGKQSSKRFRSHEEALVFLAQVSVDPKIPSRLTLNDWLDEWEQGYKGQWAYSTALQRHSLIKLHVRPSIGLERLLELRRGTLVAWRADLLSRGVTPKTINAVVRVLSSALSTAVDHDLIPANPILGLKSMPTVPANRNPVPLEDVEKIRMVLDPRDRALVSVLAYSGLRPSEALALEADDIIGGKALMVRKAIGKDGKIKQTKTKSVRSVPVPLPTDLDGLPSHGLLFPGTKGNLLNWNNWTARVFRPAAKVHLLNVVPYELRHTAASLMIAAGNPVTQVAYWLGHAKPSMTLDVYSHLFAQAQILPGESLHDAIFKARFRVMGLNPALTFVVEI